MTNAQVTQAWARGIRGTSLNMHTDGLSLWSYLVEIGTTDHETGRKTVLQYTKHGDHGYISQTTSQHVALANRYVSLFHHCGR